MVKYVEFSQVNFDDVVVKKPTNKTVAFSA